MKKLKFRIIIGGILTAASISSGNASEWSIENTFRDSPEQNLHEAYQAYDKFKLKEMVRKIKAVMVDENSADFTRSQAVSLWQKAMKENSRLPSDWKLPSSIKELKINIETRNVDDGIKYEINLKGETTRSDYIKQLQVIKFPAQVLIDRENKVYREWEEGVWDGTAEFKGSSRRQKEKFEQGLYFINIDTVDGKEVRGWFILSDENSTDTPDVYSPQFEERLDGPHPLVHFEDFKSPEFQGYEYRGLWVGVTRLFNDSWQYLWGHYEGDPKRNTVALGKVSESSLDNVVLKTGKYWLTVKFTEMKKFGDLKIGRASRKASVFYVK